MKLLIEEAEPVKVLTEEKNGKMTLYIEGNFMMGNVPNKNNRLYPMDTLREAVRTYNKNFIVPNRAVGELNHNTTPSIDLAKVSHIIKNLEERKNYFYGKAKILNTPMGNIVSALIDDGVVLGVSSRALGSVSPTNEGYNVVGKDLMISCVDIVADPSVGPAAFVNGIYEGKEWLYDTDRKEYVAYNIKNKIEKDVLSRKLNEQRMLMHFENYLKLI